MAILQDDELLQMFFEESKEHLDGIESDFLDIEEMGEDLDVELVNKVFRAIHSVKGGAGFLGLDTIKELTHNMENILNKMRNSEIIPTPELISTMLSSLDKLNDLINDFMNSNEADISENLEALQLIIDGKEAPAAAAETEDSAEAQSEPEQEPEAEPEPEPEPEPDPEPVSESAEVSGMVELGIPGKEKIFSIASDELKLAGQAGKIVYIAKFDAFRI